MRKILQLLFRKKKTRMKKKDLTKNEKLMFENLIKNKSVY